MLKNLGKVIVPSIVEAATLIVWFALALAGRHNEAAGTLFAGLYAEHLITQIDYAGGLTFTQAALWAAVSAFETIVWGGWFSLQGSYFAYVELFTGLVVEHTVSENILEGRGVLSRLSSPAVLAFTGVELVVAAALEMVFMGPIKPLVISALSALEHTMELDVADAKG